MKAPVLLLTFNRPEHTKRTFEPIKRYQPKELFISIDGPRLGDKNDTFLVKDVKDLITSEVDWDCNFKLLENKENLGAGYASVKAINWFFEHVDEGIILDDDCVADDTFFPFCQKALKAYSEISSVMHISGSNFLKKEIKDEYFISKYNPVWGWATWKRAWESYNFRIDCTDQDIEYFKKHYKISKKEDIYWTNTFNSVSLEKRKSTWDYQWTYHIWKNKGKCIVPGENLITNIGFDETATHAQDPFFSTANLCLKPVNLNKLDFVNDNINHNLDKIVFHNHYLARGNWLRQFKNCLIKHFPVSYSHIKKIMLK